MKFKKKISDNKCVNDTDEDTNDITNTDNISNIRINLNNKLLIIPIIPIIIILLFKININYERLIYLTIHLILLIISFIYLDSNFQILNNFKFYKIKLININKPIILKDLKLVLLTQKVLKNMKNNNNNHDNCIDDSDNKKEESNELGDDEKNINDEFNDIEKKKKKKKNLNRKSNSFDLRLPIITSNNTDNFTNEKVSSTTLPLPLFFGGGHHTRCFSESIPQITNNKMKENFQNKYRYRNRNIKNRPLSLDDYNHMNDIKRHNYFIKSSYNNTSIKNQYRDINSYDNTIDLSFENDRIQQDTEEEEEEEEGNETYGSSLIDLIDSDFTKDEIQYNIENKNSNRNSYLSQLSNSSYSSYTDDENENNENEEIISDSITRNPLQFTITPKISMMSIGIETIRGNDFEDQEDLEVNNNLTNEFKSNNMYINNKKLKRNSMLFIDQDDDDDDEEKQSIIDDNYSDLNLRKLNLLKQ